jgi:hypothetical protein
MTDLQFHQSVVYDIYRDVLSKNDAPRTQALILDIGMGRSRGAIGGAIMRQHRYISAKALTAGANISRTPSHRVGYVAPFALVPTVKREFEDFPRVKPVIWSGPSFFRNYLSLLIDPPEILIFDAHTIGRPGTKSHTTFKMICGLGEMGRFIDTIVVHGNPTDHDLSVMYNAPIQSYHYLPGSFVFAEADRRVPWWNRPRGRTR